MVRKFLKDESGAVTIDWVAITAGVLLLGIALVYGIFNNGVSSTATSINANLSGVALAAVGSAPQLNGGFGAAPMRCNAGHCVRDTDGDGNYDSTNAHGGPWSDVGNGGIDQGMVSDWPVADS